MAQEFDDLIFDIRPVTINSVAYGGGKTPWGYLRVIYNDSPINPIPDPVPGYAIDPPVPPVWPILGAGKFSSDLIYGSERMNTNLVMFRGDTYSFNAVAVLNGEVLDLTGYTLKMSCKKNLNDNGYVFQLTSNPVNGITILDASTGSFSVTIPHSATVSLPAYKQRFPFDVQVTSAGGAINTIIEGYLIIKPQITTS